jgi:hypothetical protein
MSDEPQPKDESLETIAALQASVARLEGKNRELIADIRKSSGVKPEDLAAAESRADAAEAKLATLEKSVKTLTTERDTTTKALEAEQGVTHKLIAENGLVKALMDNGVTDPAYLEAAKAMHIGAVKVVAEGDTRKALYGDKEVNDAVKDWAASPMGQKFVAAPVNSGGGANGNNGGGAGAKTADSAAFNAMAPKDRAAFMAEGGIVADKAA